MPQPVDKQTDFLIKAVSPSLFTAVRYPDLIVALLIANLLSPKLWELAGRIRSGGGGPGGARDGRPPGVAEAEQASCLVEGLAGGVVDGLAEESVGEVVAHLDEERMAPGDDEGHEREGRLGTLGLAGVQQPGGVEVTLEMVDADEGDVERPGERLGVREADEEGADQARAGRDGDRADVPEARPSRRQHLVERRVEPAQVGPSGELGDDPAARGVERDLAIVVDEGIPAGAVAATLRAAGGALLRRLTLFDVYRGAPLDAREKSLAWRLAIRADDRPLDDGEVDAVIGTLVAAAAEAHGARVRA